MKSFRTVCSLQSFLLILQYCRYKISLFCRICGTSLRPELEAIRKDYNKGSFKKILGQLFVPLLMEGMDMEYCTFSLMLYTGLDTNLHIIPF